MSDPLATDRVLRALVEARGARRPSVLVTVVASKGSTPRKPGAKMLVHGDSSIVGTVGGGALEHTIIDQAVAQISAQRSQPTLIEKQLTHELGMCCGGGVTLLMEPQVYAPCLYIFGAGHVALALSKIASLSGFEVVVIDGRAELATQDRFPEAKSVLAEEPMDCLHELELSPSDSYAVVVTHDHGLDEEIVAELMTKTVRFLGVIGSTRKREMFRKRLASRGLDAEAIDRLHTPVGVDISAETPEEIAVSIAAQLIAVRRSQ